MKKIVNKFVDNCVLYVRESANFKQVSAFKILIHPIKMVSCSIRMTQIDNLPKEEKDKAYSREDAEIYYN